MKGSWLDLHLWMLGDQGQSLPFNLFLRETNFFCSLVYILPSDILSLFVNLFFVFGLGHHKSVDS